MPAKTLKDANERERRRSQIDQPHVRPLNDLVRELQRSDTPHRQVPWFDPHDGGVDATLLFLYESPGPATNDSAFISIDNNDPSAANAWEMHNRLQLPRSAVVRWNSIPWFLGRNVDQSLVKPKAADLKEAAEWTVRLINLLPALKAVVLFGDTAWMAWTKGVEERLGTRRLFLHYVPHTSQQSLNQPGRKDRFYSAMERIKALYIDPS